MRERLAPLDCEPVSVHAPFVSYPGGQYRYEGAKERRAALVAALGWVELGAYDECVVQWLAGWDVPVVAGVISLLWRACHAAAVQARPGEGESR